MMADLMLAWMMPEGGSDASPPRVGNSRMELREEDDNA